MTSVEICPPEVAANMLQLTKAPNGHRLMAAQSMDMWSLGCVLYQLTTQRLLLADLQPDLPNDVLLYGNEHNLLAWKGATQAQIDKLLTQLADSKKGNRLIEHSCSLMKHLLKVGLADDTRASAAASGASMPSRVVCCIVRRHVY